MSYNGVINVAGSPFQMQMLEGYIRGKEGENKVKIINLDMNDLNRKITPEEAEIFRKFDSLSKIYIVDHGSPNSPSIGGSLDILHNPLTCP